MNIAPGTFQIANAAGVFAHLMANPVPYGADIGPIHVRRRPIAAEGLDALAAPIPVAEKGASATHAFLAPQLGNIPPELKALPRWLLWMAEGHCDEKPRKVPYNPTLVKTRASSTDPDTWGAFDQAEAAYEEGGWTVSVQPIHLPSAI